MPDQTTTGYIKKEEEKLQQLFNDYRFQSKDVDPVKRGATLTTLLSQIQQHALFLEKMLFPLSGKINNERDIQTQIECLVKDHENLCELVGAMLKHEEEEGFSTTEEQEAFHVLLVNHLDREAAVLRVLDECLSEKERQVAMSLEIMSR